MPFRNAWFKHLIFYSFNLLLTIQQMMDYVPVSPILTWDSWVKFRASDYGLAQSVLMWIFGKWPLDGVYVFSSLSHSPFVFQINNTCNTKQPLQLYNRFNMQSSKKIHQCVICVNYWSGRTVSVSFYSFEKQSNRERDRPCLVQFLNPYNNQVWASLKSGVSLVGGWDPSAWAIIFYFPGFALAGNWTRRWVRTQSQALW